MNLGFVTFYAPETVKFAGEAGFDCLEIQAEPGTEMDFTRMTPAKHDAIMRDMESNGVRFSALGTSQNHLLRDDDARKTNMSYFLTAIRMCREFGTNVLMTNGGGDPSATSEENMDMFERVFSRYAEEAEKQGVRIAVENCPHFTGRNPYTLGNILSTPEMFDEAFRRVDSANFGIEYDPSHLFWLGIDVLAFLKRYPHRIFAMHAKDCEILEDKLELYGILGRQLGRADVYDMGWWRYRIPGCGQVDFPGIAKVLDEIGYRGCINIEHEDSVFGAGRTEDQNGVEILKEGLKLGLSYLKKVFH